MLADNTFPILFFPRFDLMRFFFFFQPLGAGIII